MFRDKPDCYFAYSDKDIRCAEESKDEPGGKSKPTYLHLQVSQEATEECRPG